jgi:uncharacterized protein (DUF427 family)
MSVGHTITIVPSNAHVEVRLGDSLLAATDRAMRLVRARHLLEWE